jgi:TIR domain
MADPSPRAGSFVYDVFLSYRHQDPDKTWVRKALLPHIDEAGLRACIDFRDFRLGAPLVTEMERAVVQSRYTLAILSPAYLAGPFTEFESVISQHLGLEQSQHRLLLVVREPCERSLRLRYKIWLELKDEEEFAENLPRLIQALKQPLEG